MENIFTLPYSEYEAINQIQKKLTKSEGNSCYIPVSRQQKGIDFILHNNNHNKFLRFQIKSSRSYTSEPKTSQQKRDTYIHNFWFNNFIDRYNEGNADYYIFFGLYPIYHQKNNIKSKSAFWKNIIVCFSEKEIIEILKKVKTQRERKTDKFFGFGFDTKDKIYGTRGFEKNIDLSQFLLENKLDELKEKLK